MNRRTSRTVTSPRIGVTRGPTLELPGLGLGLAGERLVAGSLPTGPGRAPGSARKWRRCRGGGPRRPNPWTKTLAIGTWNVTSLGGKEPELVREVERYRLEIVGLTSTHSLGSGTQLLERGWTLHYSGVAQGERRRAGVGLPYSSPAQPPCVGVHSGEREVASLRLRVGDRSLAVVCAYGPRTAVQSTRPSWSPWEGYLIVVLRLGTPLFYWGTSTLTWATTVIPGGA
ncbi:hypothetical protein L3Q82_023987 [Scortum barcoo]|uniref:Uncharacterized protein n=1 Tax=Scortum barcoo TaxID=214431 RepID=A0ACB8WTM9_9TELE|nr:hypothetical protein L3Q82_023987 [Scortum barcoo]